MATQEKPALEEEAAPAITIFTPATEIFGMEMAGPLVTQMPNNIVMRWCPHCLTETAQVGELPDGWPEKTPETPKIVKKPGHCLQCIADGGDCCDLTEFNRRPEEDENLLAAQRT